MVKVEEVSLDFSGADNDDADFIDTSDSEEYHPKNLLNDPADSLDDAEFDDVDDDIPVEGESVIDKVKALKYILPYTFRVYLYSLVNRAQRIIKDLLYISRRFAWVSITSIFLLGFPLYYEYQREQQLKFSDLNLSFSPSAQSF